jgi:hypothetical protein
VPVAGQDGQLPPIQTTRVSEAPPTPLGRADQALKRLVFGPPLDASAIAVERMRKLVAPLGLSVLSASCALFIDNERPLTLRRRARNKSCS